MLLRILDKGNRKKKKRSKSTQAEREAEGSYLAMQARLDAVPKFASTPRPKGMSLKIMPDLSTPPGRTNTKHIPSVNVDETGAGSEVRGTYKISPQYTGNKMLGVAVLHKSNAVPVFSSEDAVDISKMRR